jgi:hypothetical protein
MAMTPGFGNLQTPADLLAKLRHDRSRIEVGPSDQYAAFDFFVSAEHMADWVLPGRANEAARRRLRDSSILLEVTSHIANGSKHLIADKPHHRSVSHVDAPPEWIQSGWVQPGWVQAGELIVTLEGLAADKLGSSIRVSSLADKIDCAAVVSRRWPFDPKFAN